MTRKYRVVTRRVCGLLLAASALGAGRQDKALSDSVPVERQAVGVEGGAVRVDGRGRHGQSSPSRTQGVSRTPWRSRDPGVEQETALIQPGSSATLALALRPGTYEVYCPVGVDSHKKLGMETHLKVVSAKGSGAAGYGGVERSDSQGPPAKVQEIRVTGAGPVIQILPGPFPFADSAAPILKAFGDEREGLESQAQNGPYSNHVAPISGNFTLTAWDKGATGDSVDGVAEFTTQDHARWKLVLDRVQTKDVPHHPRFGGVILGLYYHGVTGVHTPLVPTINSAVALWAFGHLYRNGTLVTDSAMVHVMQLSRTRRDGRFRAGLLGLLEEQDRGVAVAGAPGRRASPSSTRRAGSCSSTGRSPAPASRRAEQDKKEIAPPGAVAPGGATIFLGESA